jgi:hypothetical protein
MGAVQGAVAIDGESTSRQRAVVRASEKVMNDGLLRYGKGGNSH